MRQLIVTVKSRVLWYETPVGVRRHVSVTPEMAPAGIVQSMQREWRVCVVGEAEGGMSGSGGWHAQPIMPRHGQWHAQQRRGQPPYRG